MIRLTMFPAVDGDCMLLEYGTAEPTTRVLIDGGRRETYKTLRPVLDEFPTQCLDAMVITHIDQDHILGALALLSDLNRSVRIGDVWFNGYDHLTNAAIETYGARDGELVTSAMLAQRLPWNDRFAGRAITVGPALQPFRDGANFTVLSPDPGQLRALIPTWENECKKHGLIPGRAPQELPPEGIEEFGRIDIDELADSPFTSDTSLPNRSSIALLFEYEGVRILFGADAEPGRLAASLRPLAAKEGGRVRLDAFKLPHHGSAKNTSKELLALVDCRRYLVSTNGSRHHHPEAAAIARVLKYGGDDKELIFNYRVRAAEWDVSAWKDRWHYTIDAPTGEDGLKTLTW